MRDDDKTVVGDALIELHQKSCPEYREALHAQWRAEASTREAEEALQERFRPHWKRIVAILRRECAKRGMTFTANHCGRNMVAHVGVTAKPPAAVSIDHCKFVVHPYIRLDFWIGHGVKLEWEGHANTADAFERKLDVLLSMLDGYVLGCRVAGGRNCATCAMPKIENQYKKGNCDRCKTCKNGLLWIA